MAKQAAKQKIILKKENQDTWDENINITEDGIIELDIRFASFDYSNANMSFENLVTSPKQVDTVEKLATGFA